jgi:predicted enzyme related to lactoylglutathione lyase
MIKRDGYPPGVPCWVDTAQPDPDAAVDFYAGLFGWEFDDRMPAGRPGRYLVAQLQGGDVAAVGSQPEGAPSEPVWSTYIWVESAAEAAAKAKDAGGSIVTEPFEVADAGRMAILADPDGAAFCVWQARSHKGAQVVNAPGSWNFSDLNTPNPDEATAFYGAVFGWEATRVDLGELSFTMFRLPGYGDFLALSDPDIRARQAEQDAPEGFEDAVAGLVPGDGPSHWSVTFSVDDTDGTAERAAELGATVVVPPFDAGPARVAVLRDPQGAVFSVSTYDPQ